MVTLLITKKIKECTDILQGFGNENFINTKKKKKKKGGKWSNIRLTDLE